MVYLGTIYQRIVRKVTLKNQMEIEMYQFHLVKRSNLVGLFGILNTKKIVHLIGPEINPKFKEKIKIRLRVRYYSPLILAFQLECGYSHYATSFCCTIQKLVQIFEV